MENVTKLFDNQYRPISGLIVRQSTKDEDSFYVESYDIDSTSGKPMNFHPLSVSEAKALAERMMPPVKGQSFLQPKGLMPTNVLHINPGQETVIWHTPPQKQTLFFTEYVGITDGSAHVPALLWKANRRSLRIFAIKSKGRPSLKTKLYNAPLFNTSANGAVCIGTVDIDIGHQASLEEFIATWHRFYFQSRFSHGAGGHHVTTVPTVNLWQDLIETGAPFPNEVLTKSTYTLQSLLSLVL